MTHQSQVDREAFIEFPRLSQMFAGLLPYHGGGHVGGHGLEVDERRGVGPEQEVHGQEQDPQ